MAIVQMVLVVLFGFGGLLTMLFAALVAGIASADRARVPDSNHGAIPPRR